MSIWKTYSNFLKLDGDKSRDRSITRTKRNMLKLAKKSPAYKDVIIDGKKQSVLIISSSTELDTKKIVSMPNETINIGSIVEWSNEHWIIYDNDCEDSIYQRGIMYRCNVYLKWQNETGQIVGRYGYIEDVSKSGVGIKTSGEIVAQLEQYYKGYFPLDNETVKIRRDKRFLMDIDNLMPDAYVVTNRKVMNYNFNALNIDKNYKLNTKDHLIIFMFTQTQRNNDRDNFDIMIADYVDYDKSNISDNNTTNKHINIAYSDTPTIRCGGSYKTFVANLIDENGKVLQDNIVWQVISLENEEKYFEYIIKNNNIQIKALFNEKLIGSQIMLLASCGEYKSKLFVKVVSLYE